jgi:HAT1-interacting factor 1
MSDAPASPKPATIEEPKSNGTEPEQPKHTIESATEAAQKAFALRKYEEAVENYAAALELATEKYGERSLECANLYFVYGKALLENAISHSAVLGKEEAEGALRDAGEEEDKAGGSSSSRFHFGGDGEDEPVDLLGQAAKANEEEDGEEEEEEEGEPEDDFNAAWEVLDLARTFFEKHDDDESKLKLGDIHITLGDVSLETENFSQAITDYTAGLKLKSELLPLYSRQIAEAHYKLSIVLDLTSGRLSESIEHAEKALQSVEARLVVLRDYITGTMQKDAGEAVDPKGKGRAKVYTDPIENMTKEELEGQVKEFEELRTDLQLKTEDLKATPEAAPASTAPEMAAQSLDEILNRHFASSTGSGSNLASTTTTAAAPVNDLTSIVRKKKPAKPAVEGNGGVKRKAEEIDDEKSALDKKAKLDETPA